MPERFDASEMYRVFERQRRAVLARDEEALRELTRRWMQVERRLGQEIKAATAEALAAHRQGVPAEALRYRLLRLQSLREQVYAELAKYGEAVADLVTERQRLLAGLAATHVRESLERMGTLAGVFDRLPVGVLEGLAGTVGRGGPLYEYFMAGLPEQTVTAMLDALVEGVALGQNPKVIARAMAEAAGIAHKRALVISRSEALRAYRSATWMSYRASEVVEGWVWLCSKSPRTCMACLAKDGERFGLEVEFVDHPQGRCTMVPYLPGREVRWQTGQDWFREQPDGVQKGMMGPLKWAAWKRGEFDLGDLAQEEVHATFGRHWRVATLAEARGKRVTR